MLTNTCLITVGSMLAGALQAAIYNSMDGRNGISGWRWMFVSLLPPLPFHFPSLMLTADILAPQIIDGIVTLVVSFAGLVLIPDFPSKPKYVFAPIFFLSFYISSAPTNPPAPSLPLGSTVPGHSISAHPILTSPALAPPNSVVPIIKNSPSHL